MVLEAQSSSFTLNTPQGSKTVRLPFAGEHNVENATAAAAFALAIGINLDDIVAGLEQAVGAKGRLNFIPHKDFYLLMTPTMPIRARCERRLKC